MLGYLVNKFFDGFICVLCFFSRDPSRRKPKMTRQQKNALKGLSTEQQKLLKRLWEEMLSFNSYSDAYTIGHFDKGDQINVLAEQHQQAVSECQKSGIPEDRIKVFQINSIKE